MQVTGPLIVSAPLGWTVTSLVYQPFVPGVPAVTVRSAVGPVLSSLIVSGAAFVVSPASLVQEPLKVWPAVSAVCDWSFVQVSGLLTSSAPDVCTVTSLVYQPFAPAVPAVTDKATAVGAVASNLKLKATGVLMLPALSVHVPVTDAEAVSGPL